MLHRHLDGLEARATSGEPWRTKDEASIITLPTPTRFLEEA
ncbi:MAG: hypothetical protein RJQ04_10950 [Longimicrobiales bacterium]